MKNSDSRNLFAAKYTAARMSFWLFIDIASATQAEGDGLSLGQHPKFAIIVWTVTPQIAYTFSLEMPLYVDTRKKFGSQLCFS